MKNILLIILFLGLYSCQPAAEKVQEQLALDSDSDGVSDILDCAKDDDSKFRELELYIDKDQDGVSSNERVSECIGKEIPDGLLADVSPEIDCDDENPNYSEVFSGGVCGKTIPIESKIERSDSLFNKASSKAPLLVGDKLFYIRGDNNDLITSIDINSKQVVSEYEFPSPQVEYLRYFDNKIIVSSRGSCVKYTDTHDGLLCTSHIVVLDLDLKEVSKKLARYYRDRVIGTSPAYPETIQLINKFDESTFLLFTRGKFGSFASNQSLYIYRLDTSNNNWIELGFVKGEYSPYSGFHDPVYPRVAFKNGNIIKIIYHSRTGPKVIDFSITNSTYTLSNIVDSAEEPIYQTVSKYNRFFQHKDFYLGKYRKASDLSCEKGFQHLYRDVDFKSLENRNFINTCNYGIPFMHESLWLLTGTNNILLKSVEEEPSNPIEIPFSDESTLRFVNSESSFAVLKRKQFRSPQDGLPDLIEDETSLILLK